MSVEGAKFDPYFKWMRIPRREQPPTHYRLLGLPVFHDDSADIESAALQQAEHVRRCGETKFPEVAEHLIAQIHAARDCLLDAAGKAAYDEVLRTLEPKPQAKLRKNRFDALQVSDMDSQPAVQELALAPLPTDEAAIVAKSVQAYKAGSPSMPRPAAALPPVNVAGDEQSSDVSAASVIKLVVAGCALAGGITYAVLSRLSSRPQVADVGAEVAVVADTSPTTSSLAAVDGAIPADPALLPSAKLAGSSWKLTTERLERVMTLNADGSATMSDAAEPGTWSFTGDDLNVRAGDHVVHLEQDSEGVMLGLISGILVKAVRIEQTGPKAAGPAAPKAPATGPAGV